MLVAPRVIRVGRKGRIRQTGFRHGTLDSALAFLWFYRLLLLAVLAQVLLLFSFFYNSSLNHIKHLAATCSNRESGQDRFAAQSQSQSSSETGELLSMASSWPMVDDVSRWRRARPRFRVTATRDASDAPSDAPSDDPGEFSLPLSDRLLSRRATDKFQFESLFPNSILLSVPEITKINLSIRRITNSVARSLIHPVVHSFIRSFIHRLEEFQPILRPVSISYFELVVQEFEQRVVDISIGANRWPHRFLCYIFVSSCSLCHAK